MSSSTTKIFRASLAVFALVACAHRTDVAPKTTPAPVAVPADAAADELKARLDRLTARLEEARVEHHVPGLAIAVVKGDEVLLAAGLGHADLAAETPATSKTVFAIGSSTKAFTSTLVGMLVDEGKLAWDEPVSKHVPELKLAIDAKEPGAQLTIRDALSHRSGFTRMSLLWASGQRGDTDIWQLASKAEPWAKYREKFLYNNVVYASAGEAAARAAGTTWADLLQTRLLDPLKMSTTTVDQAKAEADPRRAQGYVWRSVEERFEAIPMRPVTSIAPAGAIYSNVEEMASWLKFQLAKGKAGDSRLVSEDALMETRKPQMAMSPAMSYGMGWMLELRDGKTIVHHGGNIDGYAAMVAMMPQEQLGFVLLTNVSATPLQSAAAEIVFDSLLGDMPSAAKAKTEDLEPLTGTYVASFGGFKADPFVVTERAGKLYVDIPRQMNFEILPADEKGLRHFAITDQIAVSFGETKEGRPQVLRVHQNGFVFEAWRQGFVPEPEIPIADLQPLLGEYRHEDIGMAKVAVQNNHLTVIIDKQGAFELEPPGDDGKRKLRARADVAVEIAAVAGKPPEALTVHQGGKELVFTRVAGQAHASLPSVDELMRLRRLERTQRALQKVGVLEARGKVKMPQSGIEGTVVLWIAADGRFATHVDLGKSGTIDDFVYPDRAWTAVSFAPLVEHHGKFLEQARTSHVFALQGDWRTLFDSIDVVGATEHEGRAGWSVVLRKGEIAPMELVVDAKTGDILSGSQVRLIDGGGGLPTRFTFSRYRTIHGLRVPMRQELSEDATGKTIVELESVKRFTGDPATVFPAAPPR